MYWLTFVLFKGLWLTKGLYFCCRPNPGFMKQLELFEAMGNHVNQNHAEYRQYRLGLFATQMTNCECFKLIVIISAVKLCTFIRV